MKEVFFFLFTLLLAACNRDDALLKRLEAIKEMGNHNPSEALCLLDSIHINDRGHTEYAIKKHALLKIRLSDKADIISTSDSAIASLIPYFECHGTPSDKQEVYYYAGSVYRDLHDTPRALENFLRSLTVAEEGKCDSLMLRNTYSNLHWLYYKVQDYRNALDMALHEVEVAEKLGILDETTLIHAGVSYMYLDNVEMSCYYLGQAGQLAMSQDPAQEFETHTSLLANYVALQEFEKAKQHFSYLNGTYDESDILDNGASCLALGAYYAFRQQYDSARHFFQYVIAHNNDIELQYEAAKRLFNTYFIQQNHVGASKSAATFIQLCDSLNLGERQRLAATVNNEFQYYRNQEAERRIKAENEHVRKQITIIPILSVFASLFGVIFYFYLRQRQLKKLLAYDSKLKTKEQELKDKTNQSLSFLRQLHQAELEGSAEDVIQKIRKSSIGLHSMSSNDWKELYQAVDSLHPDFKKSIVEKAGLITERQLQVCYLMCIGLSNSEIEKLTDLSAATVWRYATKYSKILNLPARPTRQPRQNKEGKQK